MCTDGILLDAVEDENTHKPETLPLGSLYWEEREKKISSVYWVQGKKHKKGLVTEDMTSGRRFWGWASRRREGNELDLEESLKRQAGVKGRNVGGDEHVSDLGKIHTMAQSSLVGSGK